MNVIDSLKNGSCLISISRICDLVKLDFANETEVLCLHVQSALLRILKNNELLISSNDIFLPSKNYKNKLCKRFKSDIPGNTLFDDRLSSLESEIINKKINDVRLLGKDLIIKLEDGYRIDVLSCTLEWDKEFFRLFRKGDLDSHIVIES